MKTLTAINVLCLLGCLACLVGSVGSNVGAQNARRELTPAGPRRCRCSEPEEIAPNLRNGVLPPSRRRGIGDMTDPERN